MNPWSYAAGVLSNAGRMIAGGLRPWLFGLLTVAIWSRRRHVWPRLLTRRRAQRQ